MRNVTIALDEQTLEAGREYASAHHTSLSRRDPAWIMALRA
jgi:hypothetical protein